MFLPLVANAAATINAGTQSALINAIASSEDGDTINITNNIVLIDSEIAIIDKAVVIEGNGHSISVSSTGLNDDGTYNTNPSAFRVFNISSAGKTIEINDLTIKGGAPDADGAGIFVADGTILKLTNVQITNSRANSGFRGGAITNENSTVYLKDCNISRNAADNGGGFFNSTSASQMFIENTTFSENRSTATAGGGGAGENRGLLYVNNATFSNNKSTERGGAIKNTKTAYFINCTFVGNVTTSTTYKSGAIANLLSSGTPAVTVINSVFAYNYSLVGSTYVLNDMEASSTSYKIKAYYCILQSTYTTYITATSCTTYTGNASGSDNSLVTGGISTKVLAADGSEVGTGTVFQPFLAKKDANSKTPTALLKNGSLAYAHGCRTAFTNGDGTPTMGYYNGSSWVPILGTSPASCEVLLDQNYEGQLTPRSVGAVITYADNLYMLKVNSSLDGTTNGGTVYGDVYPSGTLVSLTAIANDGKLFDHWNYVTGGTGVASTSNPYQVTVDRNITLVPVFEDYVGVTITYSGNGSTSGSVPTVQSLFTDETVNISSAGTMVRKGYVFSGWNTRVDGVGTDYAPGDTFLAEQSNLVLYAKWTPYLPAIVTVTKNDTNLVVNIKNWQPTYKYQIWSYQKITSDIFLNATANVPAKQWILSKEFTLGSLGALQADNSINFNIANFISPDENYTIAVRIFDQDDNYVSEQKDTYTPTQLGIVKITKVLVDGAYSVGQEVKQAMPGAFVNIDVVGNDAANITYSAKVLETSAIITSPTQDNKFVWDISALTPGKYNVQLTATNGATTDKRTIEFVIFTKAQGITYGTITNMTITPDQSLQNVYNIVPSFSNANFYYTVGEPGRVPFYKYSGVITPTLFASLGNKIAYTFDQFGIYQVYGYVKRADGVSYDDGIRKQIEVKRSNTIPSTLNVTVKDASNNVINTSNPIAKDTAIKVIGDATIGGLPGDTQKQYSFWRYDADNYKLIKDWSADNTLDWTPAKVGNYIVEVRAKGADAGSYEVVSNINISVNDTTEAIAQNLNISINAASVAQNAIARTPIQVIATATATNGDDLLYKFYITDVSLGVTTTQQYSASQAFTWVPRKAGQYKILVLVKNQNSFGRYDAQQSFDVTVN